MQNATLSSASLTFSRTEVIPDVPPIRVTYIMRKTTPLGQFEATKSVAYMEFLRTGAEAMDGRTYFELGHAVYEQELRAHLERSADWEFGGKGLNISA